MRQSINCIFSYCVQLNQGADSCQPENDFFSSGMWRLFHREGLRNMMAFG